MREPCLFSLLLNLAALLLVQVLLRLGFVESVVLPLALVLDLLGFIFLALLVLLVFLAFLVFLLLCRSRAAGIVMALILQQQTKDVTHEIMHLMELNERMDKFTK